MDELFKALANVHRRRLLIALLDHNPQQDTVDLPEDAHRGGWSVRGSSARTLPSPSP